MNTKNEAIEVLKRAITANRSAIESAEHHIEVSLNSIRNSREHIGRWAMQIAECEAALEQLNVASTEQNAV